MQRTVLGERCAEQPLLLHSDNGAPMKSVTLLSKLYGLSITPSRGRPRVSNDNPYSESLFRTLKYCPQWPQDALPIWTQHAAGCATLFTGTTMSTATAASASYPQHSAIVERIKRCWPSVMRCTRKPVINTRIAGQVQREIGNQSVPSHSTRKGSARTENSNLKTRLTRQLPCKTPIRPHPIWSMPITTYINSSLALPMPASLAAHPDTASRIVTITSRPWWPSCGWRHSGRDSDKSVTDSSLLGLLLFVQQVNIRPRNELRGFDKESKLLAYLLAQSPKLLILKINKRMRAALNSLLL